MGLIKKHEMGSLRKKFKETCEQLNIKKTFYDEAFSLFNRISNNYSLDGDKLHWLSCALYCTILKSAKLTVSNINRSEEKFSLTQLLKSCNLNLLNFFISMKKWVDMANVSQEIKDKTDNFEKNFILTTINFKKYCPIFLKVFKNLNTTKSMKLRSKKQKSRLVLTSNELFKFCWTLFIYLKFNFSDIETDLTNSFHLLVACIGFCFNNIFYSENLKNLINPSFTQLPDFYQCENLASSEKKICIISILCKEFNGIFIEAKGIQEYWLEPHIKRLVERKILKCNNLKCLTGFIDLTNFDFNLKNITNEYESYVFNNFNIDERIFLYDDDQNDLNNSSVDLLTIQLNQLKNHIEEKKSFVPTTPLSNRHLLNNRDYGAMTPISNATQTVNRLQSILVGYTDYPSIYLKNIFESLTENLCSSIEERIEKLSEKFLNAYISRENLDDCSRPKSPIQSNDFAKKRLHFAVTLYYKMLENILKREEKMIKNNLKALTCVLSNELFHIALFACSIEIVLFAYKSQQTFPWIINILKNFNESDFQPIDFYKVIELVIRDEERFSRDIVKHLTLLEERVLESLVWKSDSKIWDKIKIYGTIPAFQDVSLSSPSTPSKTTAKLNDELFNSDRLDSPVYLSIRRKLFDSCTDTETITKNDKSLSQQKSIKLDLKVSDKLDKDKSLKLDTLQNKQKQSHGPLGLFFRKVYYLSWLRLKDLCEKLKRTDEELLSKIWTCFESAIRFNIEVLKDRHLDQIIMCTIYSICKITKRDITFHEIMESYRHQPQSESHVYRSIFLGKKSIDDKNSVRGGSSSSSKKSLTSVKSDYKERGDIIIFYNQIYVTEMKKYIMKFSIDNDSPPLSPLPKKLVSPFKKISLTHPVFVSPLKSSELVVSPKKHNMYSFSISPSNDLRAFNYLVKSNSLQSNSNNIRNNFSGILNSMKNEKSISKRMFQDTDSNECSPIKKQCSNLNLLTSKIQNVFSNKNTSNDTYSDDSNLG